jgi:hypothetical protein
MSRIAACGSSATENVALPAPSPESPTRERVPFRKTESMRRSSEIRTPTRKVVQKSPRLTADADTKHSSWRRTRHGRECSQRSRAEPQTKRAFAPRLSHARHGSTTWREKEKERPAQPGPDGAPSACLRRTLAPPPRSPLVVRLPAFTVPLARPESPQKYLAIDPEPPRLLYVLAFTTATPCPRRSRPNARRALHKTRRRLRTPHLSACRPVLALLSHYTIKEVYPWAYVAEELRCPVPC